MSCTTGINILSIDDDTRHLEVVERLLTSPTCNVVSVTSGTEALRQILKSDFALILLDVSMPDMDGFEVATLIRQVKRSCHIPIIFLASSRDAVRPVFRGCGAGVVEYISKPVDPGELQSLIGVLAGIYIRCPQGTECDEDGDVGSLVRERTTSLIRANELLRQEVARRQRAEEGLQSAKREAEAATRAKSEFLANMSHEIRTPMNGVVGMVELALRTKLSAEQREYMNLVKVSAGALLTIINDILDFSRIEAGSLELESIPFSLRESIGDTIKALALDAHRKGLELNHDISVDVPDILVGDPMRLRQVITNLVGNAIKFTEHGEVTIKVDNVPDGNMSGDVSIQFQVVDSGVGIVAEKLHGIFAPFTQADTSTTRVYGGTGLGLTIAQRLVELMGGSIGVNSEVGRGSVFHFHLKFGVTAAGNSVGASATFPGFRALIANSHAGSRRILADVLRHWNVDVDEEEDMADAISAIAWASHAGIPYHLVLLDENLPDANIYSTIMELQLREDMELGALVAVGSMTSRESDGVWLDSARFPCVSKPLKHSELLALVMAASTPGGIDMPSREAWSDARCDIGHGGFDILLVEDNPINSRVAQQVLTQAGHSVVTASNGEAAIVALGDRQFDLVLMDVQMPGMDGLETTAVIRAMEAESGGHIPIFALTAHAMPQHRQRCLQGGMDGYLVKPIHPAELLNAVAGMASYDHVSPSPGGVSSGMNRTAFLQRIGGDINLLGDIAGIFLDTKASLMGDLEKALVDRDESRLGYVIHTMSGMFSSVAAESSLEILNSVRALVEAEAWREAEVEVSRLKGEMDIIAEELIGMAGEMKSLSCVSHKGEELATKADLHNKQALMEASQ